MKKLKQRWGIESNFQLFIILLVFSLNGSLSLFFAKPILTFLGITIETLNPILFWALRILVVFIVYQFLLVALGALFGQYKFFWKFEKKMLSRIGFKQLVRD
ncbi:MAG: diacylglyceryl transferase [Winogradskyella sp.]|nr:MAG: diacylglyceryl transferase [Winogradskyella sp.]